MKRVTTQRVCEVTLFIFHNQSFHFHEKNKTNINRSDNVFILHDKSIGHSFTDRTKEKFR